MNNEKKKIIAIMGPSGSGKTTLGTNLQKRNNIIVPRHTTTREKRNDDTLGFYRYITHSEYQSRYLNGEFLISSGDSQIISKEYGNFYGVLKKDSDLAFSESDAILLYTSYKDINNLILLRDIYEIIILNLTFTDIAKGVRSRLETEKLRNHTLQDIEKRIYWALKDDNDYRNLVDKNSTLIVYTDIDNIEETYAKVCKTLKLERR